MPPADIELLLLDILARLGLMQKQISDLGAAVAKLNGLPGRVRNLENWRSGLTAVGSAVVLALGFVIAWVKGGK